MNEHFIVTLDREHLRIYTENNTLGEALPKLEVVEVVDVPAGGSANPFGVSNGLPASTNRRTTGKRDEQRRALLELARELDAFLHGRPDASWDFAAAPSLFNSVIEQLSPDTRRRLKRVLSKDIVNRRAEEVHVQFATAGR